MSTECCGKPCDTPFCPQCGKKVVRTNELEGLQLHIRQRIRSLKNTANEAAAENGVDAPATKAAKANLNKWLSWDAKLQTLLATK